MALTDTQRKMKESAELELLITGVMGAMRRNNINAVNSALQKVDDFRSDSTFADLVSRAGEVLDTATDDLIDDGIGKLGTLVGKLDVAGETFKQAAELAETGQKELLLPMLAANAAKTLELFTEFQAGVEKLQSDLEAIDDLNVESIIDIVNAVKIAKSTMNDLKDKVEAIA